MRTGFEPAYNGFAIAAAGVHADTPERELAQSAVETLDATDEHSAPEDSNGAREHAPQYETDPPPTAAELAGAALWSLKEGDLTGCEAVLAALIAELAGR